MDSRNPSDPFDPVRRAFDDLGTSEKAAFVLEATFETIGQALAETGRRAAATLDDLDIDSWFRPHAPRDVGAPPAPPPAPPPPAAKATRSTKAKPSGKKPSGAKPSGKTAGKPAPPKTGRRPPADDE